MMNTRGKQASALATIADNRAYPRISKELKVPELKKEADARGIPRKSLPTRKADIIKVLVDGSIHLSGTSEWKELQALKNLMDQEKEELMLTMKSNLQKEEKEAIRRRVAKKDQKEKDDERFVIVTTKNPSQVEDMTREEFKFRSSVEVASESYATYAEAVLVARNDRRYSYWFDGWEDIFECDEENDLPPWNSSRMENGNDDEVIINVLTKAEAKLRMER